MEESLAGAILGLGILSAGVFSLRDLEQWSGTRTAQPNYGRLDCRVVVSSVDPYTNGGLVILQSFPLGLSSCIGLKYVVISSSKLHTEVPISLQALYNWKTTKGM